MPLMTTPGDSRSHRTPSPRRRTPAWVPVVGVVILGAVATLVGLAVLDGRPEPGTDPTAAASPAVATPTPTVPATPTVSPTPSTEEPTAAPTVTAGPDQAGQLGLPAGLLPSGSVVTVMVDGLRIREEPAASATIVATMASGDAAYVIDSIAAGPIAADGHDWYQVEYADGREVWPWQDLSPATARGWVAAASSDVRYLEIAEVVCPTESVTLEALAFEITPWARLVCLRGGPIRAEGTFGCDTCIEPAGGATPGWLADVMQQPPIAGQYWYLPYVQVAVSPGAPVPENRDILRATLRVDDPAAATCTYASDGTSSEFEYDPIAVETFCRERLVLNAFEVIGTDDFGR
jgi:hypothetical protein